MPVLRKQPADEQTRHIYNQFVIRGERRDELQAHLKERDRNGGLLSPSAAPAALLRGPRLSSREISRSAKLADDSLALPVYPSFRR